MRVMLVEDDPVFASALKGFLKIKGFVVEHASNCEQARSMMSAASWDVVLLDWGLPDGEGVALLPSVRRHAREASVIMLTARDQISDRIQGLDAGADDYLVKPFDPEELLARLRAVERRKSGLGSAVVQVGRLRIDLARSSVSVDGVPVELTAREWSLLRVLGGKPDRIHSKESLIEAVYGFDDEVGSNTLEVFISHLRRKLGRESIQTLRGLGYRLGSEGIGS
jgi:two-component system OmpR family response regulator